MPRKSTANWKEIFQQLSAPDKQKIKKKLVTTLRECSTNNPLQKVSVSPTSEGEPPIQRVAALPPIKQQQI